jgi:hypothetical protein
MAFTTVLRSGLKNNNPGRPNPKSNYILVWQTEDLAEKPVKEADNVTVSTNLVFKEGKFPIEIYATPVTIEVSDKSSGDPDKKGFIHTIKFEYPGSEPEYSAFIDANVNMNLMAMVVYPDLEFNKMAGWPGNPLQLNHEQKDDKTEDTNIVTLESLFAGDKMLHYTGDIPTTDEGSGAYNL